MPSGASDEGGSNRTELVTSDRLTSDDRTAVRAMLDEAFEGDFGELDWAHAVGGLHVIGRRDAVVAHASAVERPLWIGGARMQCWYVEAVATHPTQQGCGWGSAVMTGLIDALPDDAIAVLSTGAHHFYERLGWQRWRGPTWVRLTDGSRVRTADEDDGIMIRRGRTAPEVDVTDPIECEERPGDDW